MKNKHYFLLSLLLLMVACSPKYYTSNTQNIALISQKGETDLNLSGNENQVEFQGAYGVSKNIALMANGGLFIPSDLDNGNGGSGDFIEFGVGYFENVKQNFVFETYALLGFGSFENHLPSTTSSNPQTEGDISANIIRFGIQPNFGYKSGYVEAAISTRIVGLNYNSIKGDLIYNGNSQTDYLHENKANFLIEPALTLRGGLENIKLQLQLGGSINLSNVNFRQDHAFATIGLNFRFKWCGAR